MKRKKGKIDIMSQPSESLCKDRYTESTQWVALHSRYSSSTSLENLSKNQILYIQKNVFGIQISSESAMDMIESRLGLGSNADRRRCWCDDGRMSADKALFTKSPSTPPILTSEFVIADLRAFNLFDWYGPPEPALALAFLCILQRNEPGCVVGEHRHVLFCWWLLPLLCFLTTWSRGETEIDRPGDIGRSIENRTDGDGEDEPAPYRLTRVGEEDRLKKLAERE